VPEYQAGKISGLRKVKRHTARREVLDGEGGYMEIGQEFTGNNVFSDTVTIKIIQEPPDGTYLVLKHTNCSAKYQDEHPDAYFVVTGAMLTSGDLDFITTTEGKR
jgi:hypothetical protein